MAIYSYEDIVRKNEHSSFPERKVQYLNSFIKKDGSSVIVRFPYTSTSQFDFVSIHKTQVGDKFRNIFCLRESKKEPLDNCPLCSGKKANGEPYESPKTRFFIKLIAYIKDEEGNVKVTPCIWEQSAYNGKEPSRIVRNLADYIAEYGNLQEVPFKITRSGTGLNTEYDIRPVNPVVYNVEAFPIDFSAFDDYTLKGHAYTQRSFEDLTTLVETGDFPSYNASSNNQITFEKEEEVSSTTYSPSTSNTYFPKEEVKVDSQVRTPRAPRQY